MSNYFDIPALHYSQKDLFQYYSNNTNAWAVYGDDSINSLYTQYADITNPIINTILNQFVDKHIIENVKFFKTKAKGTVKPHCDKRNVAINIPIQTNDKSYTVFYENIGDYENPNIIIDGQTSQVTAKRFTDVKELEKLIITGATCLNTNVPHGVINNSEEDRIILSISFVDKFDDFDTIKDLYNSGNLTRTQ